MGAASATLVTLVQRITLVTPDCTPHAAHPSSPASLPNERYAAARLHLACCEQPRQRASSSASPARLPLRLAAQVALYIKQDARVAQCCASQPAWLLPHVALCRELPNAHGREAHSVASFLSEFYDRLPRIMYLSQAGFCPARLAQPTPIGVHSFL